MSTVLPVSAVPINPPVLVAPVIFTFSNVTFFITADVIVYPNNPTFAVVLFIYRFFILCPSPFNDPVNDKVESPIGVHPSPA
ncbi:hypothetical protein D3C76_904010 [compost metagenome]